MAAPAGPCEWCGGPQEWTFILGDLYVRCVDGCLPLDLEGLVPPPDGERGLVRLKCPEPSESARVGGTPEGSAAKTSGQKDGLPW